MVFIIKNKTMENSEEKTVPYSNRSFATEPTKMVKFMRVFFIFQLFNFFKLNLKVMKIVVGGHS
jgi:hypothetical protein